LVYAAVCVSVPFHQPFYPEVYPDLSVFHFIMSWLWFQFFLPFLKWSIQEQISTVLKHLISDEMFPSMALPARSGPRPLVQLRAHFPQMVGLRRKAT
jgi:hypothetical protein